MNIQEQQQKMHVPRRQYYNENNAEVAKEQSEGGTQIQQLLSLLCFPGVFWRVFSNKTF